LRLRKGREILVLPRQHDEIERWDAGGTAGFEIAELVAHQERTGQVDAVLAGGAQDHAGFGLAAGADDGIVRHAALGVMRAVIDAGKLDALLAQESAHPLVQGENVGFQRDKPRATAD